MISGLHHYALEVPDLAVAEGFLQDFGLETGEKDGSLVAMCPGRQQEQVRLVEAPAKRLHHVTFTLQPGTMDAIREALERSGTPVIEPPPGAAEGGLWLRDPDGTAVQLLDEPQAPARPAAEVQQAFSDARTVLGAGEARTRARRAVERTVPFALLVHTLVITWYARHGHDPAGITERRQAQPWYASKTEPAFEDMLTQLRRVLTCARISGGSPAQPQPAQIHAVLAAWHAAAA